VGVNLIKFISEKSKVPVIACGGAGSINDIKSVIHLGKASAAGAGSLFVYFGKKKSVLINYPTDLLIS
jgi:cyclase